MAVSIAQTFISIGCNRTPQAADVSPRSGRIAFGADCAVALWEPVSNPTSPIVSGADGGKRGAAGRGIYVTLRGHSGGVNAVKWMSSRGTCEGIVSGSVDKTVRIWEEREGKVPRLHFLMGK
jgi:WD40 repeat protein